MEIYNEARLADQEEVIAVWMQVQKCCKPPCRNN